MHSAIGGPELRESSWKAMEKAKADGRLRSIGVGFYFLHGVSLAS
jgi:diketogulonate reductase-like aldo/keto reductase